MEMLRRVAVIGLCMLLLASAGLSAAAMDIGAMNAEKGVSSVAENSYAQYLTQNPSASRPSEEILIAGASYEDSCDAELEVGSWSGKDEILLWKNADGKVTWQFTVQKSGYYRLCITYCGYPGNGKQIGLEMRLDGEVPFSDVSKVELPRFWMDSEDGILIDKHGNESYARQEELYRWSQKWIRDTEGMHTEPYEFYLSEGVHELTLKALNEPVALESLRFAQIQELPDYEQIQQIYRRNDYQPAEAGLSMTQAEDTLYKNDSSLHAVADKSSAATQPTDPGRILINSIGGSGWSRVGQSITWKIYAPQTGLYTLAFRYRQNFLRGFSVYRCLYLDGEVPFQEASEIAFSYASGWAVCTPGGSETPYQFYLTEGWHELTLEVTLGPTTETQRILQEQLSLLNQMYRKIIMITSVQPDSYRDYTLAEDIPELLDTFASVARVLREQTAVLEAGGSKGSEAAVLETMARQLESFVKAPRTIAQRLTSFQENISSFAAWILDIRSQALQLDYIELLAPDQKPQPANVNFFKSLWYEIQALVSSYLIDYSDIGAVENNDKEQTELEVWMSSGRDQATVLRRLIQDDFSSSCAIKLRMVSGGTSGASTLTQAIMAGMGPDVALNVGRGDPVNLALRDAVVALEDMVGFSEVAERFMDSALLPYELNGHIYALPETQTFHMMFYRTDIFSELGITPPNTWDDLYDIIPILQRSNMNVGLPYASLDAYSVVSSGMGSQTIYPALLLQNNGTFYNEDRTSLNLGTSNAYDAFSMWVDFYTKYNFPLYKNDYNRFRTGEMPLVITNYTFYNQLAVAAPEIRGLWAMCVIPGTNQADGSIKRTESASGSACMILKSCKDTNAAWQFINWWTSASVQASYGNEIEALIGESARYATANVKAFQALPWTNDEAQLILEQWTEVEEIPEIAGGYYVSRNIDNAFRAATISYKNPRESLNYYIRQTQTEITRKRRELGLSE